MAKRIGKYKVSHKDQALSALDGGVIAGSLDGITNLSTTGTNTFSGETTITGTTNFRKKVVALTDLANSGSLRTLTLSDSGTTFLIPALTSAGSNSQSIQLPANTSANVGFNATFTMVGTAAMTCSVDTSAGADKIITAIPDGDGTFTINASADKFGFLPQAVVGASFKITCVSTTDATAFVVSNVVNGLADGTGDFLAE